MALKDSAVEIPLFALDGAAWLSRLGSGTFYVLDQATAAGPDASPIQRYSWRVLQPAAAVQAYAWTVLEVTIIGGEQQYRWRVFAEPPTQGYTWTVIPAELLDLFASQGVGAAAGIAPDTLLPIGRATKD